MCVRVHTDSIYVQHSTHSIGLNVNKKLCPKLKNFLNETDGTNYNESPHDNLFISIQLRSIFHRLIPVKRHTD